MRKKYFFIYFRHNHHINNYSSFIFCVQYFFCRGKNRFCAPGLTARRGFYTIYLIAVFCPHLFIKRGFIFMKKVINSSNSPKAIGPYSQAIEDSGFIFTSGVLPIDPVTGEIYNGSVRVQTELILKNLENILKEAGSNLSQVVKTTVFLTDLTQFAEMNEVYASFFKENPPARSTFQVVALPKGSAVEIEAIAKK